MTRRFSLLVFSILLVPGIVSAAASGTSRRVSVEGTVEKVTITDDQAFEKEGATYTVLQNDGTSMDVIVVDQTRIMSEGQRSRRVLLPSDIKVGTRLRASGTSIDAASFQAALITVTNIELNPSLAGRGIISSIGSSSVSMTLADGSTKTYSVNNDTQFIVKYELTGLDGMTFVGKQTSYTLNPENPDQIKILRITGRPEKKKTFPISTPTLRTRSH